MATIEVIIRDDEGNVIGNEDKRIYTIGIGKTSFHEIEGAVEQFKRKALPDIEAELLEAAQKGYTRKKKTR
jgi:hypothetical protein